MLSVHLLLTYGIGMLIQYIMCAFAADILVHVLSLFELNTEIVNLH